MPEAMASIRKEERTEQKTVLSASWGYPQVSLHMTTSGSVTCSPTGKACGRSSVGPAPLVIYFLWQFILLSVRLLFLLSLQPPPWSPHCCLWHWFTTLLSQSLLSRLFNCAEDHVTFILPNNNSLWVICSYLPCSFQT